MSPLVLAAIVAAITSQAGPPTGPADDGRAYLDRLYRDRAAITSGHVEYTLSTEKNETIPVLDGSVMRFRVWFDRPNGRRRLDVKEDRPKDPDEAIDLRYGYDEAEGRHRLIDRDRPDQIVREFSKAYLNGAEAPLGPVANGQFLDPRLLGIIGLDYGLINRHPLEELRSIDPKAKVAVTQVEHGGKPARRIEVTYANGGVDIYITPDGSILPAHMVTRFTTKYPDGRAAPEIRVEVDAELAAMVNDRGETFEYPRLLKIRRFHQGREETAQTIAVTQANFNVPVDPALLTWKALNPKVGALLEVNRELKVSMTEAVAWDGEKFSLGPASPDLFLPTVVEDVKDSAPAPATPFRAARSIALLVGAILAAALVLTRASRRR